MRVCFAPLGRRGVGDEGCRSDRDPTLMLSLRQHILPWVNAVGRGCMRLPRLSRQSLLVLSLGVWLSACAFQHEVEANPAVPLDSPTPLEAVTPSLPAKSPELPDPVKRAVLQDLSQKLGQSTRHFQVERAEPHTWPDGCLGLAAPNQFCTQVLVPGWRVTIAAGPRSWVYRTNATGSQLKQEP